MDEFKHNECDEDSANRGAVWTEAETLLLLESVLKHGDDWELVAQNVQTKNKLDCILKLIELPFGELMLGSAHKYGNFGDPNGNMNSAKQVQLSSSECHETIKTDGQCHEQNDEREQNGDAVEQGPPSKRQRIASLSDAGSSLMKQVGDLTLLQKSYFSELSSKLFFWDTLLLFNLVFTMFYSWSREYYNQIVEVFERLKMLLNVLYGFLQ